MLVAARPDSALRLDPALSPADRCLAYHLRYRAYRAADGIAPQASEEVRDWMDDYPLARTYLLRDGTVAVGTVRSNVYRHGAPGHRLFLADTFPADALAWLVDGDVVIESSRLAVAPDQSEHQLTYVMRLFGAHNANCRAHGAHYVVSAAQRHHLPFYRRRLAFEIVSDPATVEALTIEPVTAIRLDWRQHHGALESRFPEVVVDGGDVARLAVPTPVDVPGTS